jgi:hypothetical protein
MRGLATRKTQSEEAVLHVMGLPRWARASARAPCASRAPAGGRVGPSSLAQGIPRAAMNPAASGGRSVEPLPRRTSDAQRDLFDERLT